MGSGVCGCELRELYDCCFKDHSFVSRKYIGIFVIYDIICNIKKFIPIYKNAPPLTSVTVKIPTGFVQ